MTRIDSSARLAELIRLQSEALRDPSSRSSAAKRKNDPAAASSAARLSAVVSRRVRAIDADDPDRRRKAFRVFLESVLLAELGNALINDPAFYQVVEQVHAHMAADPELSRAMDDAAGHLLEAARDPKA